MGRFKLIENVEVVDAGEKGKMIGKKDGWVYLLKDVIPGDIVDVKAKRKKKSFYEGFPVHFREESPYRAEPFCQHFGPCGGCKWQNIDYQKQLSIKEKQVKDAFSKFTSFSQLPIETILNSPVTRFYRNKMDFSATQERWISREEIDSHQTLSKGPALGLHAQGRFDKALDLEECHLQPEPSNQIRNAIRDYAIKNQWSFWDPVAHTGFFRSVILRNSIDGEFMVILVVSYWDKEAITECLDFISHKFPKITSSYYVINNKKNDAVNDLTHRFFKGNTHLQDRVGDMPFYIGPSSFYQTNSPHTENLYDLVSNYADLQGEEHLLDLYCGVGTIGLYLTGEEQKLTGIESIEEATRLARLNAKENNRRNVEFINGEAEKVLEEGLFDKKGLPDIVVTDPPRAGMHKNVVRFLLNLSAKKIVYVSCNPATQARDVELLSEKYEVEKLRPVDMFPHTPHVENVVLLKNKNNG